MSDARPLPLLTAPTTAARDPAGAREAGGGGGGAAMVPPLVSSITASVEHTVGRWSEEVLDPAAIDWSAVLLGALQHQVEGLCVDALRLAGWYDAAPPAATRLLDRRRLAAEARFQAHYLALRELSEAEPELAANVVVVNGAALVHLYASTSHRRLGDVDLLVPPALADRLAAWARDAGFWEKASAGGATFFREAGPGPPDAGPVVVDVRHAPLPRRLRPAPLGVGDLGLHGLPGASELVRQLVRLQRHALGAAHWVREDDVRLIRLLDVEVLAAAVDDEPGEVLAYAESRAALPAFALGLAVVKAVRGTVPAALEALEPLADVVAPCTRLLALPSGDVVDTGAPIARRALSLDKSAQARALVEPRPCTWRHGPVAVGDDRGLAEIHRRAHERLAAAGVVEPRR